jgi:mono/diheme cytochrome c family protein
LFAAAPAPKTVWDGVYTAAQAARGQERFDMTCVRCHNKALIGSERGPALKGTTFWSHWENDSLNSLFTKIRDTMPADGAGVLTDEVKIDILAYLLQASGYPAGSEELKLDARALESIKVTKKAVWNGVYTAAQAERGKSTFLTGRCGGCHQLDLSGDRGPALKGPDFLAHWENGSVNALFSKIRDTMPPNDPQEVADAAKVDVVAYLLQSNGFPAGSAELAVESDLLESIEIVRKDAPAGIPNFSLVQVVGCLGKAPSGSWALTHTSDASLTKDDEPSPAVLKAAQSKALGAGSFQLISVTPFGPESHQGHKMEARGLVYRDGAEARLNLTSLRMLDASCTN